MEVLYMSPIGKGQNYPQLCHCAAVLDYWSVVSGGPIQQLTVSGAVSIVGDGEIYLPRLANGP